MTYTLPAASTANTEGVDFTQIYAPSSSTSTTPEYPAPPFAAGTRVNATTGEYLFVLAGATITANQALGIDPNTWTASPLTKAYADAGREVAVAPVAITSTYYGWVQTKGKSSVKVKNACLPAVPLYTTASDGMLDDTSASQTRIYGIRITVTSTSSGAAKTCWISNLTV